MDNTYLENPLLCPQCGNGNLHHGRVVVYDRTEDAPKIRETVIDKTIAISMVPSSQSRNPSSRRDGLAIEFNCESCDGLSELTVEQHKGSTYLNWRITRYAEGSLVA
jgi:hypothetical protein